MDWHGLAQIGQDWQIGEFVSERKIGPRLAQDWLRIGGLAPDWPIGTGLDWIDQIGKLENFCPNEKLAPDWHRIGMDWHGLARIDMDWHGLARIGTDWHGLTWIGTDWHGLTWIGTDWHGLARIGQDWQIGKFVSERKIDP